jgi:catechol 2,3-dioxygenase-like lactoylglutathione lyase family enzyme
VALRFLEHVLILTDDPEGTRDWWVKVLGFRSGSHPEFGFPVYWLYIGDQDVIHIGQARHSEHQDKYLLAPDGGTEQLEQQGSGQRGSGRIDHLCFNSEGIEDFIARLDGAGVNYNERQANGQTLYQLFFWEPINGIKIELNFSADEARRAGRMPALTASDAESR